MLGSTGHTGKHTRLATETAMHPAAQETTDAAGCNRHTGGLVHLVDPLVEGFAD